MLLRAAQVLLVLLVVVLAHRFATSTGLAARPCYAKVAMRHRLPGSPGCQPCSLIRTGLILDHVGVDNIADLAEPAAAAAAVGCR